MSSLAHSEAGEITPALKQPPRISILILNWNNCALTLTCIASVLRHMTDNDDEIIVVDNGSRAEDLTELKLGLPPSVRLIALSENLGFGEGNNIAAEAATGKYLLFLNNDVRMTSDIATELIQQFEACFSPGAVGPMFLYPDDTLQEAGAFLLPNGWSIQQGKGGSPVNPHFLTGTHIVDYCSAACLLVERHTFMRACGFDPLFDPAYFEDCDLCLRLRSMGLYTYYASGSRIYHDESKTTHQLWSDDHRSDAIKTNHARFFDRWKLYLENRLLRPVSLESWERADLTSHPARRRPDQKALLRSSTLIQISDICSDILRRAVEMQADYAVTIAAPEACSRLRIASLCRHYGIELNDFELGRNSDFHDDAFDRVLQFNADGTPGGIPS